MVAIYLYGGPLTLLLAYKGVFFKNCVPLGKNRPQIKIRDAQFHLGVARSLSANMDAIPVLAAERCC